jgi:hypothetical protein
MQVYMGGGYGYVWVQRLDDGQHHFCVNNGNVESIASDYCPLENY